MLLLLACTAPVDGERARIAEPDGGDTGDGDTAGEDTGSVGAGEAYDYGGCVETTHLDYAEDDTWDTKTVRLLRDAERAWSTDRFIAGGLYWSDDNAYDERGCRTGYTAYYWVSGHGTTYAGQTAECDAFGNWVETESWTDALDDALDEAGRVRRYANTYDGDLLAQQIAYAVAEDGSESESHRYTYTYDHAGRVVEETYRSESWDAVWTYTYDARGNLAERLYERDGDVTRSVYTYDTRDRPIAMIEDDSDNGDVDARTTWTYTDDTPRPSVVVTDDGDDGTPDETTTYTWDCPP